METFRAFLIGLQLGLLIAGIVAFRLGADDLGYMLMGAVVGLGAGGVIIGVVT